MPSKNNIAVAQNCYASKPALINPSKNIFFGEKREDLCIQFKQNSIAEVFRPVVSLLRVFGHCPLTYKSFKTGRLQKYGLVSSGRYEFQWQSVWILWSVLCFLVYTILWAVFTVEGMTDFRLLNPDGYKLSITWDRSLVFSAN